MVTVTGLTAERMEEIENASVVDGNVVAGELILLTHGGTPINAGNVMGPTGPSGGAFHICTSSTRPAVVAGDEGKAIYETDTDLVRTWTGTRWRLQEKIICTSTTRPTGLVAADEGVKIYETDTGYEYSWTGASWVPIFYGPPGIITAILGDVADVGCSLLDGGLLNRTGDGVRLFAKWGTKYGVGNGSTTFNKPDARGYVLAMAGGAISGTVGDKSGSTTATAPLPTHNHGVTDPGHVHAETGIGTVFPFGNAAPGDNQGNVPTYTGSQVTGITIQNAGAGGTHNNVQPTLLVNWQVSL